MEKVIINSYEEFEKLVGQQIGVSDYVELSQERINLFACLLYTSDGLGDVYKRQVLIFLLMQRWIINGFM